MEIRSIKYKQSNIFFHRFGEGEKILFCFHGYGEDAQSFTFLENILGKEYTLIALDLPFHGRTNWKDGLLFTGNDLVKIINLIVVLPDQKITILGYSMGGRVALKLLQIVPNKIEKIILIAPDGLHHNIWHRLSTQTLVGNKLFAYTMRRPFWMFTLMKVLYRFHLFNKSIFNFVHYYLDDANSRMQLFKRWTTMRRYNANLGLLKKIIKKNKIPIQIMFGKYDRIILTKSGNKFKKNIDDFVTIKEIEAGHQLLKSKFANDIASLFRS